MLVTPHIKRFGSLSPCCAAFSTLSPFPLSRTTVMRVCKLIASAVLSAGVVFAGENDALPIRTPSTTGSCVLGVKNDIFKVQEILDGMINDLSDFEASLLGDLIPLTSIQMASFELGGTVNKATAQLLSCDDLNHDDTAVAVEAVIMIVPKIHRVLDLIMERKPEFDIAVLNYMSAGFIVEQDLIMLKNGTDKLSAALAEKCSPLVTQVLNAVTKNIDTWFDEAIAMYKDDPLLGASGAQNPVSALPTLIAELNDTVPEIIPEVTAMLPKLLPEISAALPTIMSDLEPALETEVPKIFSQLAGQTMPTDAAGAAGFVATQLESDLPKILTNIPVLATGLGNDVLSKVMSAIPALATDMSGNIVSELPGRIESELPNLLGTAIPTNIIPAIMSNLPGMLGGIMGGGNQGTSASSTITAPPATTT
uniref:ARAD1D05038p n=1 Tax=Blastobotrys adeninivorans TaxID=409370 RepID=A0A060T890_BLAAD